MQKKVWMHDFFHTMTNQLWKLISGPVILVLIPLYLSPEIQGYWFTFISLAALAVFADLGFTAIILQFSAHEFAYLHFDKHKRLIGKQEHINRISSLFRFALGWSIKISLIVFPVVMLIGYFVLSKNNVTFQWLAPWSIYSTASILFFINNIVLSFIEGCDSVGDIQKIRFHTGFANALLVILGLIFGIKLFALAFALLGSAIVGTFLICQKYRELLQQLYNDPINYNHDWKKEILPLFLKYAISWASGYFIFSIFTPITFHYYGAIEAGRVGLSISLWTAIFGIAFVWMNMIIPKINILIAKGEYGTLNPIFYRHLCLSAGTFLLGMIAFFGIYNVPLVRFAIENRLVSELSLLYIALCWLMQVIVSSLAIYMRAHKKEPLLISSFLAGLQITLSTWLIARYQPFEYFFLGFLSSYLWVIPCVVIIFNKYRNGNKFLLSKKARMKQTNS
jgi:hypothetical protein